MGGLPSSPHTHTCATQSSGAMVTISASRRFTYQLAARRSRTALQPSAAAALDQQQQVAPRAEAGVCDISSRWSSTCYYSLHAALSPRRLVTAAQPLYIVSRWWRAYLGGHDRRAGRYSTLGRRSLLLHLLGWEDLSVEPAATGRPRARACARLHEKRTDIIYISKVVHVTTTLPAASHRVC